MGSFACQDETLELPTTCCSYTVRPSNYTLEHENLPSVGEMWTIIDFMYCCILIIQPLLSQSPLNSIHTCSSPLTRQPPTPSLAGHTYIKTATISHVNVLLSSQWTYYGDQTLSLASTSLLQLERPEHKVLSQYACNFQVWYWHWLGSSIKWMVIQWNLYNADAIGAI